MKNEESEVKSGAVTPAWWQEVPEAEKAVIRDVLGAIRGLKGSKSGPVSSAARKWERTIACFIKFRLQNGNGRMGRKRQKALEREPKTDAGGPIAKVGEQLVRSE